MAFLIHSTFAQKQDLLSGKFPQNEVRNVLVPQAQWTPFPKGDDRAEWANADQTMMQTYLKKPNHTSTINSRIFR